VVESAGEDDRDGQRAYIEVGPSGKIIVGDPCYFIDGNSVGPGGHDLWGEVVDALYDGKGNENFLAHEHPWGKAVMMGTAHGDGSYDGRVEFEDGEFVSISIDTDEEETCEECGYPVSECQCCPDCGYCTCQCDEEDEEW